MTESQIGTSRRLVDAADSVPLTVSRTALLALVVGFAAIRVADLRLWAGSPRPRGGAGLLAVLVPRCCSAVRGILRRHALALPCR